MLAGDSWYWVLFAHDGIFAGLGGSVVRVKHHARTSCDASGASTAYQHLATVGNMTLSECVEKAYQSASCGSVIGS